MCIVQGQPGGAALMKDVALFALTLCCGAVYECACVFWVHYSEGNRAWRAVAFSMLAALVTVIGIEQSIRRAAFVLAYVLGYGVGTYLAISIKARWLRR